MARVTLFQKIAYGVAIFMCVTTLTEILSARPAVLEVHFLDVGQGDSIFIETPADRQILIDAGRTGSGALGALAALIPFTDRSLDIVVATHLDVDHIGGLVEVFERYEVSMILVAERRGEGATSFWDAVEAEGAEVVYVEAPMRVTLDEEVVLEILSPAPSLAGASDNERSIVAKLVYRDDSFLLTGDMEKRAEYALLASGLDISADVLKVAHHGSNSSSTPAFLAAVAPRVAVVQVGENSYGHPHPDVLARLAGITILRNDENGTITLTSTGDSF
ncbi:MAG: MBL fold metallo-hydrolase [Candidatus Spechtbacterales bacterium]